MARNDESPRGRIEVGAAGAGVPSEKDVERRARELAVINGRSADQVNEEDRRKPPANGKNAAA